MGCCGSNGWGAKDWALAARHFADKLDAERVESVGVVFLAVLAFFRDVDGQATILHRDPGAGLGCLHQLDDTRIAGNDLDPLAFLVTFGLFVIQLFAFDGTAGDDPQERAVIVAVFVCAEVDEGFFVCRLDDGDNRVGDVEGGKRIGVCVCHRECRPFSDLVVLK